MKKLALSVMLLVAATLFSITPAMANNPNMPLEATFIYPSLINTTQLYGAYDVAGDFDGTIDYFAQQDVKGGIRIPEINVAIDWDEDGIIDIAAWEVKPGKGSVKIKADVVWMDWTAPLYDVITNKKIGEAKGKSAITWDIESASWTIATTIVTKFEKKLGKYTWIITDSFAPITEPGLYFFVTNEYDEYDDDSIEGKFGGLAIVAGTWEDEFKGDFSWDEKAAKISAKGSYFKVGYKVTNEYVVKGNAEVKWGKSYILADSTTGGDDLIAAVLNTIEVLITPIDSYEE